MAKPDLDRELKDEDYDLLDGLLSRIKGGKVPNVETLDGFLTGLIVCPELVPPSEFIPIVLSGETEEDGHIFDSQEDAEQIFGLIIRIWNEISSDYERGEIRMPYLAEYEEGKAYANDWAKGFLRASLLRHEAWLDVINDEEHGGWIIPIWALAYENSEDAELRPYDQPVTHELREELIAGMIAGAKKLYDIFRSSPHSAAKSWQSAPPRFEKVGRNDPCPCGSGKKFKKCCGGQTLH